MRLRLPIHRDPACAWRAWNQDSAIPNDESLVDTNLCKLIAWLSVCVLAAAWGSNLDPSWRPIWREVGAFGLVSAFGLSTARQLHSAYRRRADQRTTEGLLTRRLATELFQADAPEHLKPIVERFFADFNDNGGSQSDRRLGTASHPPARLYAFEHDVPAVSLLDRPGVIAHVRNISLNGIGFVHDEPIPVGPALIVYSTRGGERLVVGVLLSWCRPSGDGEYTSGGHFVEFSHGHPELDSPDHALQLA